MRSLPAWARIMGRDRPGIHPRGRAGSRHQGGYVSEQPNGSPPAPAPPAEAPGGVPMSERMMGVFGLAVALGIALIAFDLLSGGAVSRLIGRPPEDGSDGG